MKKALTTPTASLRDFDKRADGIFAELQKTLLPEHASEVIGLDPAFWRHTRSAHHAHQQRGCIDRDKLAESLRCHD
jgi:hypothetical protein